MIAPEDELLHPVGSSPHWQESFYFNWVDPRHGVFGLARLGFRFHERRVDALVLTLRHGRPAFLYPAVGLRLQGGARDLDPRRGLRAAGLSLTMEEPLRRWRLELTTARRSMRLCFEAETPPFDFREAGALAANMAGEHFEQAGRVTGFLDLGAERLELEALGQRDKSWGVRDWGRLDGWTWVTAHCEDGFGFNATESFEGARRFTSGFVHEGGVTSGLREVGMSFTWSPRRARLPETTRLSLVDGRGVSHEVVATTLGSFPLLKRGVWLEEAQAAFVIRSSDGRERRGHGVVEHVWRPPWWRVAARLPTLASVGLRTVRP